MADDEDLREEVRDLRSEVDALQRRLDRLESAVDVGWALFGLALLGVGLVADGRGIRLLGVGVLGVATAKVFLYDTRDLDTVARTLSFLVVGTILLAASYVYARSWGDLEVGSELSGRD